MTVDRKPTSLYAEDAATIKIYPGWDGDPNKPRYLYEEFGTARKVPLRNDELIMPILDPATYRYGLSPVQVLMDTIKADIEATKQALRTMQQKPPPNAFQIPSASASQLEALRDAYDRDIAGQKELFWFGGPTQAVKFPLVYSAKDNQFLEYQIYLVRKICALLQMSPQSLGVTFDINKANGEVQQDIDENTGLIPLLLVLESYFNRELVADYAPPLPYGRYDLNAVNLRIMYPMISEQARQLHAQESMSMATQGLAGLPSVTLNQVLAARGELPAKGGDVFWIKTATGAVPWVGYDNDLGDFAPISTGGSLGSQDAAGGPDIDAEDPSTDEEGSGPSPDADGPSTAEKSLWYDARPPGMPWKPKYMRWSNPAIAPRIATKSSDKPWISKDEAKANKALRKEATRIFEEAAERGKKG
jgi:Phage portal protein